MDAMQRSELLLTAGLLVALLAGMGSADVLVTESGKRHEGRVTEKDDSYVIERPSGGSREFPKSIVKEVVKSGDTGADDASESVSSPAESTALTSRFDPNAIMTHDLRLEAVPERHRSSPSELHVPALNHITGSITNKAQWPITVVYYGSQGLASVDAKVPSDAAEARAMRYHRAGMLAQFNACNRVRLESLASVKLETTQSRYTREMVTTGTSQYPLLGKGKEVVFVAVLQCQGKQKSQQGRYMLLFGGGQGGRLKLLVSRSLAYDDLMAVKPPVPAGKQPEGRIAYRTWQSAKIRWRHWVSLLGWCDDDRVIEDLFAIAVTEQSSHRQQSGNMWPGSSASWPLYDLTRLRFYGPHGSSRLMSNGKWKSVVETKTEMLVRWRKEYDSAKRLLKILGWKRKDAAWVLRSRLPKPKPSKETLPLKIRGGLFQCVISPEARADSQKIAWYCTVAVKQKGSIPLDLSLLRLGSRVSSGKERVSNEPMAIDWDTGAIVCRTGHSFANAGAATEFTLRLLAPVGLDNGLGDSSKVVADEGRGGEWFVPVSSEVRVTARRQPKKVK
jgi:hypothetical protein